MRLVFTLNLCIFSSVSLLKWARVLWCSGPAGPLLIKSGIKQEAGSSVEQCLLEGEKYTASQLHKEIANLESLLNGFDLGSEFS